MQPPIFVISISWTVAAVGFITSSCLGRECQLGSMFNEVMCWSLICALCLSGSSSLLNFINIPSCMCSAEEQVHEEAAQRCWSFQCSRWRSGLPGQSFCGLCEAPAGCYVGGTDWSACAHQVWPAFIPQSQGGKYISGGGVFKNRLLLHQ